MIKRLKTEKYLNSQGGPWRKVSDNKANNISEDQMPVHIQTKRQWSAWGQWSVVSEVQNLQWETQFTKLFIKRSKH